MAKQPSNNAQDSGAAERPVWPSRLLTVLNLASSLASILGMLYLLQASARSAFDTWFVIVGISGLAVTLAVSIFVLLVPGTRLEQNVRDKLLKPPAGGGFFTMSEKQQARPVILIQRGEVTIRNEQQLSVEFEHPYKDPPVFETFPMSNPVITYSVNPVTPHHARLCSGSSPYCFEGTKLRWVARGEPLYPTEVVRVLPTGGEEQDV